MKLINRFNLFRGITRTVDYNGLQLTLHIDDWIQENIFLLGTYEQAELDVLQLFLQKDSVLLDLGANFGLYSLNAAKLIGPEGKIVSFEPFSVNFNALSEHVKLNKLTNVHPEKLAVGEEDGDITLYYNESEHNLGMVTATFTENATKEEVQVVSIDSYVKSESIERIDFIKIDIEGFEYQALLGMKHLLETQHPTLLIEILDGDGARTSSIEVYRFLNELGYTKYFITNDGKLSSKEENSERKNYVFTTQVTA